MIHINHLNYYTMSPAATAIFVKPPPTFNHHRKFNSFVCTMKQYATVYRTSVRFKKTMAAVSMGTRFVGAGDDDDERISRKISGFEQEALISHQTQKSGGLHSVLNGLGKWFVAVTIGGFVILRHDDLALWAATGSVSNFMLSIILKRLVNQERPLSDMSSGPGMPSSHAQTIFFTLGFVIMSVIKGTGLNGATMILGILLVALGSYFSWLRVLLGYHTTNQVIVGTIVGSNFAVIWFWVWEAVICKSHNSNPWVHFLLYFGGACYYLGLFSFLLWHLIKD